MGDTRYSWTAYRRSLFFLLSAAGVFGIAYVLYSALNTLNALDVVETDRDRWQRPADILKALSRLVMYPRRQSLPGCITNCREIPFQIVHRVIVVCLGATQKRLRFPTGAQPKHLLHLCWCDRSGPISLNSHSLTARETSPA
jgi:hypothetical protein